ncbi:MULTISPECIES: hypothetical protein [Achromobacter]|jgi:hypothetical protein|uniref:Uncharacterized protein n=1 Tax=Achromobacter kerstersii TaxID=1353890 RepID=A0A6S7AR28_9BURK|nr:hypothetical protein [Achromobacter kerstersii]CAB3699892.1 hypothetical protein LMG3441_02495 [Achromobacter kerstersii]
MLEKTINGFSVVAYATQPEGRTPARAFLETRRLPPKVKPGEAVEQEDADAAAVEDKPEGQPFEIFVSRRFRSAIEAMSAARNALDRVKSVDEEGVPDHLPE